MKTTLTEKFTPESSREFFIGTEDLFLVESSTYDRFWGSGYSLSHKNCLHIHTFECENKLGSVLMEVRDLLQAKDSPTH